MYSFVNFFSYTPIYVYVILAYLIFVGVLYSKDRVHSINKILIIHMAFVALSISAVVKFHWQVIDWSIFSSLLFLSTILGWFTVNAKRIRVDQKRKLIFLPGSWAMLCLVLLIFASKYYLGFKKHQNSDWLFLTEVKWVTICSSAFSVGIALGRMGQILFKFKNLQHEELSRK